MQPSTASEVTPTRRLRALAFGGGALDTIMQLGVVHALLVSHGREPDHVVGISAGAVNAAALAEILQAGEELQDDDARRSMQVRRLRAFIDAYVQLPHELLNSALPDTFEVNVKTPLKPVELPIHPVVERHSRADAAKNKAGLIHLINDVLSTRLTVAAATRIVRRFLGIKQAPELRRPISPPATIVWNVLWLWFTLGRYMLAASDMVFGFIYAAVVGHNRTLRRFSGSKLLSFARDKGWTRASDFLLKVFGEETGNAATLINPGAVRRILSIGLRRSIALGVFLLLLFIPVRLFELPSELIRQIDSSVAPLHAIEGDTHVARDAYDAAQTIARIPSASLDQLRSGFTDARNATTRLLRASARRLWNDLIPYRDAIVVPLLIIAIAILLEVLTSVEVAMAWVYLTLIVIAGYSVRWFDRFLPVMVAVGALVVVLTWSRLRRRVLEYYEINDGIFSSDTLRAYFVKCFDPTYYGKPDLDVMLDAALARKNQADGSSNGGPALLSKYSDRKRRRPIHVGPVAADVAQGRLACIDSSKPIVDALLAATSVVPLFPAQDLEGTAQLRLGHGRKTKDAAKTWLIDGLNVSNEPIQPLLDDLRRRAEGDPSKYADVETVDIYAVADLPVDASELPGDGTYSTLIDVVQRALELKEFRDATMERRLTRLYTKALPRDRAFHRVCSASESRTFVHAGLFPIELEQPARVNRRLLAADNDRTDHLRNLLHETVADGCRASLEAMIPGAIRQKAPERTKAWIESMVSSGDLSIDDAAAILDEPSFPDNVSAADADSKDLIGGELALEITTAPRKKVSVEVPFELVKSLRDAVAPRCSAVISADLHSNGVLPGSDRRFGPGVAEICERCTLYRPVREREPASPKTPAKPNPPNAAAAQRRRVVPGRSHWPEWPREGATTRPAATVSQVPSIRQPYEKYEWPAREWPANPSNPVVSFLFGGGVFRGVYHMGVVTALNEMGIQPDLVAGSSVGAIIAAMIASVFKGEATERRRRLMDLSSTFLAIDRFVLTDRLADFVRKFTLRAAEAEFAARDLDRVLRRFDSDSANAYEKRLRKVAAGLERLFYFSPFELLSVAREFRGRNTPGALAELLEDVQELLERGGVGQEILGSEPLSFLIRHLVESGLPGSAASDIPLFDSFLEGQKKIFFLATTTNLSRGSLEILGAPWNAAKHVSLEHGLLASSAFPAVFRPRQAWEIFRDTEGGHRYIDGGTIDNLPLDAVARFLDEASKHKKILPRPEVPHLLFTASLEVDHKILDQGGKEVARAVKDCLELMSRASTLKYNRKIDAYASVQRRLRSIYEHFGPQSTPGGEPWVPLDLHVIAVKPNWLCSTFGFHPMLGFRRTRQAESIAHGCATTLATFYRSSGQHGPWLEKWGATKIDVDPKAVVQGEGDRTLLKPQKRSGGMCWFRTNRICPYSKEANLDLNKAIAKEKHGRPVTDTEIAALDKIYRACGREDTHKRR